MKTAFAFGVLIAAALVWSPPTSAGGGKKRSDSVVKIQAKLEKAPAGKALVVVNLEIEPGWHLYANPPGHEDLADSQLVVTFPGAKATIEYPPGKIAEEQNLGKIKIYQDKIELQATVDRPSPDAPLQMSVVLQACSDKKPLICLPPATVKIKLP